eukprot:5584048-Alexandrium_andersonii.AAC.1
MCACALVCVRVRARTASQEVCAESVSPAGPRGRRAARGLQHPGPRQLETPSLGDLTARASCRG